MRPQETNLGLIVRTRNSETWVPESALGDWEVLATALHEPLQLMKEGAVVSNLAYCELNQIFFTQNMARNTGIQS